MIPNSSREGAVVVRLDDCATLRGGLGYLPILTNQIEPGRRSGEPERAEHGFDPRVPHHCWPP